MINLVNVYQYIPPPPPRTLAQGLLHLMFNLEGDASDESMDEDERVRAYTHCYDRADKLRNQILAPVP